MYNAGNRTNRWKVSTNHCAHVIAFMITAYDLMTCLSETLISDNRASLHNTTASTVTQSAHRSRISVAVTVAVAAMAVTSFRCATVTASTTRVSVFFSIFV
jgi:hypothetical protein